jgi:hypothetical protein
LLAHIVADVSMVIKMLGVRLAVIGAAAIAVAAFLPLDELAVMGAYDMVIRQGGWILVLGALGIGGSALWVNRGRSQAWMLPMALCLLASVPVVATAANTNPDTALYVAALGVVVAMIGSSMLGWTASQARVRRAAGTCPRCARSADSNQRTCNYCGFALSRYRSAA